MTGMQTRMQVVQMQISGLDCGAASTGVRSALECIHGVEEVRMVPNEPYVTVIYDAYSVRPSQFETAVRVMGCEVERLSTRDSRASAGDGAQDSEGGAANRSAERSAHASGE